jgi:hypothetical protein
MHPRNFAPSPTSSPSRGDNANKINPTPELSTLEELNVGIVAKVPWVHGAVAPGKPLAAAHSRIVYSLLSQDYSLGASPPRTARSVPRFCE